MELAKITTKGQVTLPKTVRSQLKVDAGDNIVFIKHGNGYIIFSEKTVERGEMTIDMENHPEE